jgi:hypothetical protein
MARESEALASQIRTEPDGRRADYSVKGHSCKLIGGERRPQSSARQAPSAGWKMSEAEHYHNTPKLASEDDAIEWIAYRGTPLKLPQLVNPWRQINNLGQRYEPPPDEQKIDEEYASVRRGLLALYQFDQLIKTAAGDEMLVQLKADKLAYFTRPADDLFAELKRGHPSAWDDFQHWSDVHKLWKPQLSRLVQADRPIGLVFFFDEEQLRRLWLAGKRLRLPREYMRSFVDGCAINRPGWGVEALREDLPEAIQRQISRDLFRKLMPDPKSRKGGRRPQKPRG